MLDVCFDYTGQYIATASADGKLLQSYGVHSGKWFEPRSLNDFRLKVVPRMTVVGDIN